VDGTDAARKLNVVIFRCSRRVGSPSGAADHDVLPAKHGEVSIRAREVSSLELELSWTPPNGVRTRAALMHGLVKVDHERSIRCA